MASICQICATPTVERLLDAGCHPVANRFRSDPAAEERLFPLVLGQCASCGLIQLTTIVPVEELVPPYDWITYNEPERHLDAVADALAALPGLGRDVVIGGITYKDDSTLARLRRRGFERTWRIDPAADLGAGPRAGLETMQASLPGRTDHLVRRYGQADLLIVRHILEHAHETRRFIWALRRLLRPGGYLVFEVPDCSQVLDTLDYTTIWEEHILYFTTASYALALEGLGFDVVRLDCHPYPYENSLVAVVREARASSPARGRARGAAGDEERRRGRRFAAGLDDRRRVVGAFLADHQRRGGCVAVFGAGHLSCMFINLNGVAEHITFVVDDHPGKRGLFMPGSGLPIRSSDALLTEGIDLCLSSLSPESEEKVVARQAEFLARGGVFASIFPSSRRALDLSADGGGRQC